MSRTRVSTGRMNRRLALQSFTETRNAEGEPVKTWTNEATMWGSREPLRGKEMFDAQTTLEESVERVTVHYDSALTFDPDKRFKDLVTEEVLEIENVMNVDMANVKVEIMVVQRGD